MRWLVITQNKQVYSNINETLISLSNNNLCIYSDIELSSLNKYKDDFSSFAGCFIFLDHNNDYGENYDKNILLSNLTGYFLAEKIPVYTNLNFLSEKTLCSSETVKLVESSQISEYIEKNYITIKDASKKRLAKQKLLDRGIPFTPDCFATYIAKDKIEIVYDFLEAGMDVNSKDDSGVPMLNIACRNDNFEFTQMLLALGAQIDAVSEDRGYTALMDAIWRGNEKIAKYLINKGADTNTINKEGQSNLILAVGANRDNLVKLLVENGSDPDVKDTMGMSAYTYASLFKKTNLVEILKPYHKEA